MVWGGLLLLLLPRDFIRGHHDHEEDDDHDLAHDMLPTYHHRNIIFRVYVLPPFRLFPLF